LFILIGNYMPKTRQNYTIGIKVPWALDNEENWNRTHRLAGYLWVAGGIILVILSLAGLTNPLLLIGVVLLFTLVPTIYSWWLHAGKGL
ncbi:MAG: SdpI family protein, partial [Lachnospiraceae bacterium]|nr:SdpI family protein [Lachnospiraceae bacterium]